MPLMTWDTAKFDVHVQAMNNDHKRIMDLMNAIFDADTQHAPHAVVLSRIDALGAFVIAHFEDEEALMEHVGYPDVVRHKGIHQQLLRDFTRHRGNFADKRGGPVDPAFFDFLRLWLTAHIRNIDMRYGTFVEANHPELVDVA